MISRFRSIELPDVANNIIVSVFLDPVVSRLQTSSLHGPAVAAVVAALVCALAIQFDLVLTTKLFQFGFAVATIVAVVVFQQDIRPTVALARVTLCRWRGSQ